MVQHFGEQLSRSPSPNAAGCTSYCPRHLRTPIFTDASRPDPMTSRWWHWPSR
ncbi:hypothetical protein [Mesorhizobium sp. WSM3862]|uniref:hypothetical protein n=1 Tax=Mesorhizobium sp. WSM3862 TaxID=632858 RepID=UPI001140E509|nr:hypothetical protein [Mesorhizobium sp. WSM3862]